jgi:hypothetical protein
VGQGGQAVSNQLNFSDDNKRELVWIDESGDVWVRHDIKPIDVAKIIKTMRERINQLESENDALRADLLLWDDKEVKL